MISSSRSKRSQPWNSSKASQHAAAPRCSVGNAPHSRIRSLVPCGARPREWLSARKGVRWRRALSEVGDVGETRFHRSSLWPESLRKLEIETWVPSLKCRTWSQSQRAPGPVPAACRAGPPCPRPWPSRGAAPQGERPLAPASWVPLFQVQALPSHQTVPFWNIPALLECLTLLLSASHPSQ